MTMTTAELESLRDSLTGMNTQLDYLINRVNTLELNETPKGQYFEQLKSSFEDSPECCSCDGG